MAARRLGAAKAEFKPAVTVIKAARSAKMKCLM
jgi:hypothetical protein